MPGNPRQIVCTNCLHRQRRLLEPCEKCGSHRLVHVHFLIQQLGPDWKLLLETEKGVVH